MLFRDCGITVLRYYGITGLRDLVVTGLRDYGISSLRDYVIQGYFKIRCKGTVFFGYVQVPKTRIFAFLWAGSH